MALNLKPVFALLLSAAILLAGNGLLGVLVPIRADVEGFSRPDVGIMGSFHFAGLMAGCLLWPAIIARVGHIRAFAALTALASSTPLLHAIWVHPYVWAGLRASTGLCFAGLFMIIESWLNGASTIETRGRVLASYTVINLTVVTLGMQLVGIGDTHGFELFSLVAILFAFAAVPVALGTSTAPLPPRQAKLRLGWLFSVSPAAVLGCFFTGMANSGFWTMSPLYAKGAGFSTSEIATFLTAAVLGGAASQWPIGYLSDKLGRRLLATIVAGCAACAGTLLYLNAGASRWIIFPLAVCYGAMAFPIYTLCVAHANDLVLKKRAVEVSSGLLLTFSLGAIIGPLMASLLMQAFGFGAVFMHSAAAHAMIAAVMVLRAQQRPSPPKERSEPFIPVPKTTPAVFDLDPRGEAEDEPMQSSPPGRSAASEARGVAPITVDGSAKH